MRLYGNDRWLLWIEGLEDVVLGEEEKVALTSYTRYMQTALRTPSTGSPVESCDTSVERVHAYHRRGIPMIDHQSPKAHPYAESLVLEYPNQHGIFAYLQDPNFPRGYGTRVVQSLTRSKGNTVWNTQRSFTGTVTQSGRYTVEAVFILGGYKCWQLKGNDEWALCSWRRNQRYKEYYKNVL